MLQSFIDIAKLRFELWFLLSSDIRSKGSIAIVKKNLLRFFMVFDSISLHHYKNILEKMSVCVCVCVMSLCLTFAERRA